MGGEGPRAVRGASQAGSLESPEALKESTGGFVLHWGRVLAVEGVLDGETKLKRSRGDGGRAPRAEGSTPAQEGNDLTAREGWNFQEGGAGQCMGLVGTARGSGGGECSGRGA